MRPHLITILLLLPLLVVSDRSISASSGLSLASFSVFELPALIGARSPRLHAGPDRLTLSWVRGDEKQAQLEFSQLSGDGWSPPNTVVAGDGWLLNPYDYAQVIALSSRVYLVVWLEFTSFRNLSRKVKGDGGIKK